MCYNEFLQQLEKCKTILKLKNVNLIIDSSKKRVLYIRIMNDKKSLLIIHMKIFNNKLNNLYCFSIYNYINDFVSSFFYIIDITNTIYEIDYSKNNDIFKNILSFILLIQWWKY